MPTKAINSPVKSVVYDIFKFDKLSRISLRIRVNYKKDNRLISMYNLSTNDKGDSTLYISPNYVFEIAQRNENIKDTKTIWMDDTKYHEFFQIMDSYRKIFDDTDEVCKMFGRTRANRIAVKPEFRDERYLMRGFLVGHTLEMAYGVKYYDETNFSLGLNLFIDNNTIPIFIKYSAFVPLMYAYNNFNYIATAQNTLNLISAQASMKRTETAKNPNMIRANTNSSIFNG